MKQLSEMSDKELWEIFPIILEEHNSSWKLAFKNEARIIKDKLGDRIARLNHIGSTSVDGLLAKPTIDILVELKLDSDVDECRRLFKSLGYLESHITQSPELHILYLKGYTVNGFVGQAYHIHVHYLDDWNELYFRDYLRIHPDVCLEYAKLKLSLQKQFKHHRDNYTNAKSEFINHHTGIARQEFSNRYKK